MSSYTRTILVTGSNTGIGYDLVRLLAQKGENVYIGARSEANGKEAQYVLFLGAHVSNPSIAR